MELDTPFSNGQWHKNVKTVGELVDELNRLPRELPVQLGFSKSCDIVVFNRDSDAHVSFDDGGQWDEEASADIDDDDEDSDWDDDCESDKQPTN